MSEKLVRTVDEHRVPIRFAAAALAGVGAGITFIPGGTVASSITMAVGLGTLALTLFLRCLTGSHRVMPVLAGVMVLCAALLVLVPSQDRPRGTLAAVGVLAGLVMFASRESL